MLPIPANDDGWRRRPVHRRDSATFGSATYFYPLLRLTVNCRMTMTWRQGERPLPDVVEAVYWRGMPLMLPIDPSRFSPVSVGDHVTDPLIHATDLDS